MLLKARYIFNFYQKQAIYYVAPESKRYIKFLLCFQKSEMHYAAPGSEWYIKLLPEASNTLCWAQKQEIYYFSSQEYAIPYAAAGRKLYIASRSKKICYVSPRSKNYITLLPQNNRDISLLPKVIAALRCSRKQDTH